MNLNFNIFNSLILAGVLQGFIFGLLVLQSKKYKSKSVYFLVTLIITYSLSNLQYYFVDIELVSYQHLFGTFYLPWADLTSPLIFYYVSYYLYPKSPINKWAKLLFIPFAFSLAVSVFYKIIVLFEYENEVLSQMEHFALYYMAYYGDLVLAVFGCGVLIALFFKLKRFEKNQNQVGYNGMYLHLKWLYTTLFIFLLLILISVALVVTDLGGDSEISYYPVWIGIAILIYWLGHIGIYKYGVDKEREAIREKRKTLPSPKMEIVKPHPVIARLENYLIDQKQYLNADLTLAKTAGYLEMSQGHLSKIINSELQVSFSDFVNSLRVEEAKKYLSDAEFSNYTLVAIGLEAGFNSKSAFNASFKKRVGSTPSQFKKAQQ